MEFLVFVFENTINGMKQRPPQGTENLQECFCDEVGANVRTLKNLTTGHCEAHREEESEWQTTAL